MLEVRDVWVSYNRPFSKLAPILKGVSLEVNQGEIASILGRNGAGKTTLLRSILGLIHHARGDVSLFGDDPRFRREKILSSCGVLLDGSKTLPPKWNSDDLFAYLSAIYGFKQASKAQHYLDLLESFGLATSRHKLIGDYSRGMKQKLALCSILIHNPRMLVLDEPTIGLDSQTTRELLEFMVNFVSDGQKSIILTTHQLDLVAEVAHNIHVIHEGRSIFSGSPSKLIDLVGSYRLQISFDTEDHAAAFGDLGNIESHNNYVLVSSDNEHIIQLLRRADSMGFKLLSVRREYDLSKAFLELTERAPAMLVNEEVKHG